MKTGISFLSVIPVRENPSDKSQMVSQLLFGETVKIIDEVKDWFFIQSDGDQYEGWVDSNQIKIIDEGVYKNLAKENPVFLINQYLKAIHKNGSILLSLGSRLPFYNKNGFNIENDHYHFETAPEIYQGKKSVEEMIKVAKSYIGVPYLWGGRSYFGLDCSGFSEIVFRASGYQLPRDSSDQAQVGKVIGFINEAQPGDLAFFDNEEGRIVHVGILLNNTQIIHASGSVRIDSIDHQGIFNNHKEKYTHKLRLIKRVLY
ncbi:MAG: C40 family peptidase [Bacteroidales bacterium]|nr:C40 family peptidase [Bacteroidales bacterium]